MPDIDLSTDEEWEKWGRQDPYYGVITNPKFRSQHLDDASRQEFFESGSWHAQYVLQTCRQHIDPAFAPARVLDFGCGVGRVAIPFAGQVPSVVGVDVSPSMLAEAARNCERLGIANLRLLRSDDGLSQLEGSFDLVHSAIVFQHIEADRGRALFARLLELVAAGGICAIQVTYAKAAHADDWGTPPPVAGGARPGPRAPGQDPEMQMNVYNLNHLHFALQRAGIRQLYTEFTDHGGEWGVFLFFRKPGG